MNVSDDNKTSMCLIEDGNLDYVWQCSQCAATYKDTAKFLRSQRCPNCQRGISDWIEDEEE